MATLESEPERAVEAFESDTGNINFSMQHTNVLQVSEAVKESPVMKQDDADVHANRTYFGRLSGNIFSSGKKFFKFVSEEAYLIGNQFSHAFSTTPELPSSISTTPEFPQPISIATELPPSVIETCQLILDTIKEPDNKWLKETEYLLQNKVLTIGVFGRHKAGKSSLLNALLYHEALSVAVTNETAFILRIRHKPIKHHESSCFEDAEQLLLMKNEKIKGQRNVQNTIRKKNTDIRHKTAEIAVEELEAHVPFLCRCSTGDINIVLLDTPGLSESNELGISEASEYHLMTCSAYVYVISSQQLEDSIDTDSLRAIVLRDPNAFEERRIIIAITRLDEFDIKTSGSDSEDHDSSSGNDEEILKRIESIKEVIQRQCKCLDVLIPDDCIIPLCAAGAFKARKEKLGGKPVKRSKEMRKLMLELEVSTAEEMEIVSQILSLEEKLIEIAGNSHYLWHYSIVRDCTRYCDQAMEKLDEIKEGFVRLENKYNGKVKKKEDIMNEFKKVAMDLKSNYDKGSKLCSELETAYDKDLKKNNGKINEVSKLHSKTFEKFRSDIEKEGDITTQQFNSRAEQIIENENESLINDLKDLPFREVDAAVCNSVYQIGTIRQQLGHCLASYCDTAASTCEDPHLQKNAIISESISDSGKAVDSPHLKLSDLLEQSKVFFVAPDDPNHNLSKSEIDAFLKELEKHFLSECHNYFQKIKPKIVEGYLKQHREIAEEHIAEVEQHYFEKKGAMDAQVKAWRRQARFNKKMMKSHSDLIDNLEKQKKHLLSLAERHHGISLFSKHLQDE
ncbi:PREDICTED: uncharacterized protein LOC109584481 isoform X1 [Amphimedon queenslandica]|uniref:Dynamin N-terminal domain-containing protein n=1 Tax=Amphimedon queenslandica TaxID=400682 RepID=A0AAN0JG68_AMPQE|nr:PREDICTED: uncharacterized protein LOC109584481 isoform X1 [Amphimedon queenslandica]|eukprot:XP_019855791.1 PREDICTED: uncharacterized protein LOC109584481 isoform X1 [Amphimedon queenslandica]